MVWGPRSTYRTPDSRRKILKNLSKIFEKLLGNDLPGHLQSSEFAYAEVQGWQTFPQWSRGPIIWIFHSFLDPKIYKKFGAPPVEGTFILIPIDPFGKTGRRPGVSLLNNDHDVMIIKARL